MARGSARRMAWARLDFPDLRSSHLHAFLRDMHPSLLTVGSFLLRAELFLLTVVFGSLLLIV